MTHSELNKLTNKLISRKMNRSHYLKWPLDDNNDWSIRFFFFFANKPELCRKWVLKSHVSKTYIEVPKAMALEYILKYCDQKEPLEYFSVREFKKYRRCIINHGKPISQFILE